MGNRGRIYRNDGVDISQHAVPEQGYFVSDIETGEWLQYTIHVKEKGRYTLSLNVASADSQGRFSVLVNGKTRIENQLVPPTGGMNIFKPLVLKGIQLSEGIQQLKIYINKGGFNFSDIRFGR
ncbi:Carbohydrate binding module (family 6) [compost metagenome]